MGKKIDWITIKVDYLNNEEMSFRALSEKYNVSKRTIEDHARKEKWAAEKEERRGEIVAALSDTVLDEKKDRFKDILRIAGKVLDKTEEYIDGLEIIPPKTAKDVASVLKDLSDLHNIESDHAEQNARIKKLEAQIENGGFDNDITIRVIRDAV